MEYFITVHYNDDEFDYTEIELIEKFESIKNCGFSTIRFDYRINLLEKDQIKYLFKTKLLLKCAACLKFSIIPVISSIFVEKSIIKYLINLQELIAFYKLHCLRIQILNEWNNSIYTPTSSLKLIPDLIKETKEVFGHDIKIYSTIFLGSILTSKINFLIGITDPIEFLNKHSALIDQVDVLGIDYYPGTWEVSLKSIFATANRSKYNIEKLTNTLSVLKEKFPNLSIDLGEIGAAKLIPFNLGDRRQAFITISFLRTLKQSKIFTCYDIKSVGFYIAESPRLGEAVPKFISFSLLYSTNGKPSELNSIISIKPISSRRKVALSLMNIFTINNIRNLFLCLKTVDNNKAYFRIRKATLLLSITNYLDKI